MRRPLSLNTRLFAALALLAPLLFASSERAAAQSTDIAYPAPVFSNEITGRIQPRDPGDARQTRHFYVFRGTEGDVTVTVESAQLNGDVDVFAGRALRPLLKVTMFGGTTTKATKSVYLRREETLILRVEARAVGDAEGSYRILLGGAFAPAPPELAQQSVPETTATPSPDASARRGTRRVTSTGARIDEPPRPEVAEATPTPTPEATPAETTTRAEERTAATREPARTRRGRNPRGATSRRRAPAAQPTPSPDAPATGETAASRTGEEPRPDERRPGGETSNPAATPPATTTSRRRGSRESNRRRATPAPAAPSTEAAASAPAAPPPAVTITRLVILTKDGQTLERDMQTVRRVTIENNQVVVTLKDGKAVRTPLANVEKMSFEP